MEQKTLACELVEKWKGYSEPDEKLLKILNEFDEWMKQIPEDAQPIC